MKQRKTAITSCIRDFFRLAGAQDILAGTGRMMMRKSLRTTLWTAGITSSGYLSSHLGLPGFTGLQAILIPLIIGGGMLGMGAGLTYVPRTLSRRLVTIAEANDLNLMEDYRKSLVSEHLDVFWDRVFRHESALRFSDRERAAEQDQIMADRRMLLDHLKALPPDLLARLGAAPDGDPVDLVQVLMAEHPAITGVEKSREGFVLSCLYAMRHSFAQATEAEAVGYRLALYEDYCDGACFDPGDTKLLQQYEGSTTLNDIKAQLRFGHFDRLRELPAVLAGRFWQFLISRKIAGLTGRAVKTLNDAYHTDRFNCQSLLWPGEENARWLQALPQAGQEVLRWRHFIVKSALGPSYDTAQAVLDRMLLPCFELATRLRMRYDPEYGDHSLDGLAAADRTVMNNAVDDLTEFGYHPKTLAAVRRSTEKNRGQLADFLNHLRQLPEAGRIFQDGLALRAVKIAFHINADGLRKDFLNRRAVLSREATLRRIEKAAAEKHIYTGRLICLRLHHTLTLTQIQDYRRLARALAYDPQPYRP